MPKEHQVRLAEALDVSGAFDNCFFHNYILHLYGNELEFPGDLFTFESILGDAGHAAKLRERFPNMDSLSVFAEYTQRQNPGQDPIFPSFIFEKTLVLGFFMREWFATTMAKNQAIGESLKSSSIEAFKIYKDMLPHIGKEGLLSSENGVLFQGNQEFLDYFCTRSKKGPLTPTEKNLKAKFEKYFTPASKSIDQSLQEYWQAEGYKNYCAQIAKPDTKLSYREVTPVIEMLEQPLTIYTGVDKDKDTVGNVVGNDSLPKMETRLNVLSGHYYLLGTDKTEPLLQEYDQSSKKYKDEREQVIAISGTTATKLQAAEGKSSLLLAATDKSKDMGPNPFALLLNKVDAINKFVHASKLQEVQQQKAALKSQLLEAVEKDVNAINDINNIYINQNTEDYLEILQVAMKKDPKVALKHASTGANYAILMHRKNVYIHICSEVVKQDGATIADVNPQLANKHSTEYKKIAIEAVKQSEKALFGIEHHYPDNDPQGYRDIILIAVQHHGLSIQHIKDRIFEKKTPEDFEFYKDAVLSSMKQNSEARQYIKWDYVKNNPKIRDEIIFEAVTHHGLTLQNLEGTIYNSKKQQDYELYAKIALTVMQHDPEAHKHINWAYLEKAPTAIRVQIIQEAVKHDGLLLAKVSLADFFYLNSKNLYASMAFDAVRQNAFALQLVTETPFRNQTAAYEQVIIAAVEQNGETIGNIHRDYVESNIPSYQKIVANGVQNNGLALGRINSMMYDAKKPQDYEQYKDILLFAIQNNSDAHKYIKWDYLKTAPIAVCAEIVKAVEKLKSIDPSVTQPLKEAQQRIQAEEQRLAGLRHNAEAVIDAYVEQINKLPTVFPGNATIEIIQSRKVELLQLLEAITKNKPELIKAKETLQIADEAPKIVTAIQTKTAAVNEAVAKAEEKFFDQQSRERNERIRNAEAVIDTYVDQINKLPIVFPGNATIEIIQSRKVELLQLLEAITKNKPELIKAKETLQIADEAPKIVAAIQTKTTAINEAVAKAEEKFFDQQSRERNERIRNAEAVITTYVDQINQLQVTFPVATTIELIQDRKEELAMQLAKIKQERSDVTSAKETLKKDGVEHELSEAIDKISKAINKKDQVINSTAQQLVVKVEEQRKAQEENDKQRAEQAKQRDEQEKARLAEQEKQRDEQEKARLAEQEKQRDEQEKVRETEQEKQSDQNAAPTTELSEHHKAFNDSIGVLLEKMEEFKKNPKFDTEPLLRSKYLAACELHKALNQEGQQFFTKEATQESYKTFKTNCKGLVRSAQESVLGKHSDWNKVLLVNIFAMIITLGVGYAIAAGVNVAYNKGKFTFFDTDATKKLSTMEQQIEEQANNAAPAA